MVKRKRDYMFVLDADSETPLYRQIYDQARAGILGGQLEPGDRLPSIRQLSNNQGVSHTTVEQAYLQLSTEGYVRNIPRSGYVVETLNLSYFEHAPKTSEKKLAALSEKYVSDAFAAENARAKAARYDFSYANLQPDSFPARTWCKLVGDVLYANSAPELSRYRDTNEPSHLSHVLSSYLARTRGIDCQPEQVLPQAGTDGAISTILQLFDREKDVMGMEEPGYATAREVAERMGIKLVPLPIDNTGEPLLDALEIHKPKIVFTTPSHQFPTGQLLSLKNRIRLLNWANENNSYIIEDDSCNEFRYDTAPIPSLHSLDVQGRVIYLCNVSKVLSPNLRIAYIVLPPALLERYFQLFAHVHPPVSLLEQEVLARFIDEGHWSHLVRQASSGNKARHDRLLACLKDQFAEYIQLSGEQTGMHLFAYVDAPYTQKEFIDRALAQNAAVYGTRRFWFSQPAPENALMLGFSAIALKDIEPGVAALKKAWL